MKTITKEDQDLHKRFQQMKKDLGLTNNDLAEITGNSANSIKTITQPNNPLPRWLKLAIWIHEHHQARTGGVTVIDGGPGPAYGKGVNNE